jgi:hypothetical protein
MRLCTQEWRLVGGYDVIFYVRGEMDIIHGAFTRQPNVAETCEDIHNLGTNRTKGDWYKQGGMSSSSERKMEVRFVVFYITVMSWNRFSMITSGP